MWSRRNINYEVGCKSLTRRNICNYLCGTLYTVYTNRDSTHTKLKARFAGATPSQRDANPLKARGPNREPPERSTRGGARRRAAAGRCAICKSTKPLEKKRARKVCASRCESNHSCGERLTRYYTALTLRGAAPRRY